MELADLSDMICIIYGSHLHIFHSRFRHKGLNIIFKHIFRQLDDYNRSALLQTFDYLLAVYEVVDRNDYKF